MSDRTVHARLEGERDLVRYDRAGKWFIEGAYGGRRQVSFGEAVETAYRDAVVVYRGRPGGSRFDEALPHFRP